MVQQRRSSGGVLHVQATNVASALPSNVRLVPGRGRSLSAASKLCSTNCLRNGGLWQWWHQVHRHGLEQDVGAGAFAGGDGAFLGQVVQGGALGVSERDQLFLTHGILPFSRAYTRDLVIHQNHRGEH